MAQHRLRHFAIAIGAAALSFAIATASFAADPKAPKLIVTEADIGPVTSFIDGGDCQVYIVQKKNTVHRYSWSLGNTDRIVVTNPNKLPIVPVVDNKIAALVIEKRAYAYSSLTGSWKTIDLPAEAPLIVGSGGAKIDAGDKVFLFSAASGKWTTIDLTK